MIYEITLIIFSSIVQDGPGKFGARMGVARIVIKYNSTLNVVLNASFINYVIL